MIDLSTESPLSLNQAARLLPAGRRNRPVSLGCVLRWVLHGAKAPSGALVRLEALRLGGRWITSREALQRFAEALTPLNRGEPPSPARTLGQRRRRAVERAEQELGRLGI
jgi:hypothetical protein